MAFSLAQAIKRNTEGSSKKESAPKRSSKRSSGANCSLQDAMGRCLDQPSPKRSSSKRSSSKKGQKVSFTTADGRVVNFTVTGKKKRKSGRKANAYARFAGPRVRELMAEGMTFGQAGKRAAKEWRQSAA